MKCQNFEETIKHTNNYAKLANILISDIQAQLNTENISIDKLPYHQFT